MSSICPYVRYLFISIISNKSLPLSQILEFVPFGITITLVSELYNDLSKGPRVVSSRFFCDAYCLPACNVVFLIEGVISHANIGNFKLNPIKLC